MTETALNTKPGRQGSLIYASILYPRACHIYTRGNTPVKMHVRLISQRRAAKEISRKSLNKCSYYSFHAWYVKQDPTP